MFPPEVAREVCEWLIHGRLPDDPPGIGLKTAIMLAGTSKWLYEPCVSALWRTLPNVALLLWTLPRECYKRARVKDHLQWTMFVSSVHDVTKHPQTPTPHDHYNEPSEPLESGDAMS